MASQLTDDLILSHRLIRRRYVQIPKDQQALLDDNAWSETLSRGQHPMLNVPATVLQHVKDLHTRKYAQSTQQATPSAQPPPTANSPDLSPRPSLQGPLSSRPEQGDHDEESYWSPSPAHHFHAQNTLGNPSSNPHRTSSPPQSPSKRKTPPQFLNNEPQSSDVNSVGLEIEPPGFLSQVIESPINRTALRAIATASLRLQPTPPSAQLPTSTIERVTGQPLAKSRHATEDVDNSVNNPTPSVPVVATTKPSPKLNDRNQNSLTTTTTSFSSPSLNTQYTRGNMHKSSEPRLMSDPAPYRSFTPTFEGRRQERAAQQHLVITATPMPEPSFAPPPAQRSTLTKVPSHTPKPSQRPLHDSQGSSLSSYETFRLAYPDYSRNSRDFVTALLSVKQLKRERALHEFLYDDFIRAYSSDYFAYVSECSRKQIDKILPGIQWYNENVQDVLYTKKVVRKNNLAAFLDFHTTEAHSIRRALGDSQSTESAVEDSDEDMEDAPDEDEEHEPEVVELEREAENQASPDLQIEPPGPVTFSPQPRSQTSLRLNEPTGTADAEQVDERMRDLDSEENFQESLVQADNTRGSPELEIQSPGAANVTAPLNVYDAPQARNSTTPSPAKSFASQEDSRIISSPILSSSPGTSRLTTSWVHAPMQRQRAPAMSPPQPVARSVASEVSRPVLAADEDSDDEDAFEPPMPPSIRPTGTPSSSRRSQVVLAGKDADDNAAWNIESPKPLPQRAAGPSSTSMPQGLPVDDGLYEDASQVSKLPVQRATNPLSPSKPRTIAAEEDEADPQEVPLLPFKRVAGPSSRSRSRAFPPIGEKHGVDGGEDASESQLRKKATQDVSALAPTPRSSTAAARLLPTSPMPAAKPSALPQSSATGPQKSEGRVYKASSVILGAGRRHSGGSSIASSANMPRSKKRSSETPEQRSLRLKAFMEKQMEKKQRLSSGTPGSTFGSKG